MEKGAYTIPKWLMWSLTAWMALQLGRLIAIPLIQAVLAGQESPVWFFPALIDVCVAAATPVVIALLWMRRSPVVWLLCWSYFLVSVLDHASAITAHTLAGVPKVFAAMFNLSADSAGQGLLQGPGGQTLVDLMFMALLCRQDVRASFGVTFPNKLPGRSRDPNARLVS